MTKTLAASRTVVIGRPVPEVFAFFADGENDPIWRTGVKSIHRIGEPGVGATYEQSVAGPGGRSISADILTTAYETDRHVGFATTSGPVRPRGDYRFEPAPGGTIVTFDLVAELSGIKAALMAGPVQKTMDAEVAALDKAKQYLEQA